MSTREPHPSSVFAALGDRTRLSMLTRLCDGTPRSITRLSADTRMTRQAVTKHLRVLESAGLLISVRVGRQSLYRYRPERIDQVASYLQKISAQWDQALNRLRSFVDG
jgi:DNA-binding transcriptional ArsR family regulator